MDETDISEIRQHLKDKRIFLLPYCHADHAWCHSREWHKRRYLAIFERVIELFRKEPDFRYFIDSWSELLEPCLNATGLPGRHEPSARAGAPHRGALHSAPFIRKMLKQGRLALVGGQWSNIRFSHAGDETSIRNMVYGKRKVWEYFPEARLDAYANTDTGIGHSQVPQMLKLAGYKFYLAWRPQKGLDDAGVPRSFVWHGLSRDSVLVTRHDYTAWRCAREFNEKGETDPSCRDVDFDYTVQYAWKHYFKIACSQPDLEVLSLCQGSDDAMPFTDQARGFQWDIPALISKWNQEGFGSLSMGTPHDVFDALSSQRDKLPSWQGMLDPAELCYHIARNGKKGVWWLRELGDRELVLAEQLAAKTSIQAQPYPYEELRRCWQNHLTYCTHAIEYLFANDFDNARYTLESVIRECRHIQERAFSSLVDMDDSCDAKSLVVYNPLPEKRQEIVSFPILNVDNSRRQPVLKDVHGSLLPSQIVYAHPSATDFDVLVETDLPPCSAKQINIEWTQQDARMPEPEDKSDMNIEIASDTVKLAFTKGMLERIENVDSAVVLTAPGGTGFLEPMSLPQEVEYWLPTSFAENPLPYVPESLRVKEIGPLRFRVTRKGTSGPHHFSQHFDLYRGRNKVDVTTVVDVVRDSTNVVLGVPLQQDARLYADIPFGVEERDISNVNYGYIDGVLYGNFERRIPGIFWAKSWVYAQAGEKSFGLITIDGPRYFRRFGNPLRLLHFLVAVKPDRDEGWRPKTKMGYERGKHFFSHQLVLSGSTWKEADMVRRAQQARTHIPVIPGKAPSFDDSILVSPSCVRLSAMYREGDHIFIRIVNMDDQRAEAKLSLFFNPEKVEACDFLGNASAADISLLGNAVMAKLSPWQIMTLKISVGTVKSYMKE